MHRTVTVVVLLIMSLIVSGCHTSFRKLPSLSYAPEEFALAYKLGTGDRVRVIVFEQDNLSNLYSVDENGRIAMPLVGQVKIGGLTIKQSAHVIERRLREGFLREPDVTIEIQEFRPYFVTGEVNSPGPFPFSAGITIENATIVAGGLTDRARKRSAIITRRYGDEVEKFVAPFNAAVLPGDTVEIVERWF